jgi:hypothetical protein
MLVFNQSKPFGSSGHCKENGLMGIKRIIVLWQHHWQQIRCLQKQLLFVLRVNSRNYLSINPHREKPGFESRWGRQQFKELGSNETWVQRSWKMGKVTM